jgi:hypothetical protein
MFEEFCENFKQELISYSGYSQFPLKGEMLEERISKALEDSRIAHLWEQGSHNPGADIHLTALGLNWSVKSGQWSGKRAPKLSISSHRTTKYKTLQEKIEYFDGPGKNYTHYFILTRQETDTERHYRAYIIDASLISASSREWVTKASGWTSQKRDGVTIQIQKAMSDQFWIYVDKATIEDSSLVTEVISISFPLSQLGKTHQLVKAA